MRLKLGSLLFKTGKGELNVNCCSLSKERGLDERRLVDAIINRD